MLSPESKKDVLAKVDRITSKLSESTPILVKGNDDWEVLDGGHSLAGKLKNKSICFARQK